MVKRDINLLNLGRAGYGEVLEMQRSLRDRRIKGEIGDVLIVVEHNPVITMGRRGRDENIVVPEEFLKQHGVETHWVERGGDVTYHGPGQLVVYPVFDLTGYGRDIRSFVENLQKTIINVLAKNFEIEGRAESGTHTGVYIGENKIAAIGLAVRRWVTMHGFAFNVNTDMSHFNWIIPCGLNDRGVVSVKSILGREADFEKTTQSIIREMEDIYGFNAVETDIGGLV